MSKDYDFRNGKRGAVAPPAAGKARITIRLDREIVDWFKERVEEAGGGNYQTLINQALRDYITSTSEPLEETLRRVVREELRQSG